MKEPNIEELEFPPLEAAISELKKASTKNTKTRVVSLHENIDELFLALRNDLSQVNGHYVSSGRVVKYLLIYWFDLVNRHQCDRLRLAQHMIQTTRTNNRDIMEKNYKHFSLETTSPEDS
jgi:hypothetical protein